MTATAVIREKLPSLVDQLEKTPYLEMTTALTRDMTLAAIPVLYQVARHSENL